MCPQITFHQDNWTFDLLIRVIRKLVNLEISDDLSDFNRHTTTWVYIYIYPIMQVNGDLVVGTGIRLMADEQPCLQSL